MSITHSKVSAKSDGGDTTLVRPSDWNAAHVIELSYVQFTADVTVTHTTDATADTIVTAGALNFDGSTDVLIEFFAPDIVTNAASGTFFVVHLYDGSSESGYMAIIQNNFAASLLVPVYLMYRITPSNASHTYSIRAHTSVANAIVQAGAGGAGARVPGFIRISKV